MGDENKMAAYLHAKAEAERWTSEAARLKMEAADEAVAVLAALGAKPSLKRGNRPAGMPPVIDDVERVILGKAGLRVVDIAAEAGCSRMSADTAVKRLLRAGRITRDGFRYYPGGES